MANKKCCCISLGVFLLLIGVGALILGGLIQKAVDTRINAAVEDTIKIRLDSWDAEDQAKFIQSTTEYKFYGFNITNKAAALNGTAKLNFQQVGPYHYRQYQYKYNVTTSNVNGKEIVSFNWWWHNNPVTPADSLYETQPITIINPAYLGVMYGIKSVNPFFSVGERDTYLLIAPSTFSGIDAQLRTTGNGTFLNTVQITLIPFYINRSIEEDFGGVTNAFAASFAAETGIADFTVIGKLLNRTDTLLSITGGISTWAGSYVQPAAKAALIGTYGVDVFNKVLSYFNTTSSRANFKAYAITDLKGSPFGALFSELTNTSAYTDFVYLQWGQSSFSRTFLGTNTVDPTATGAFLGYEFMNYGISMGLAATIEAVAVLKSATGLPGLCAGVPVSNATFPNFGPAYAAINQTTFKYYACHLIPGYPGLSGIEAANGGLFTKRPLADIIRGFPAATNDPLLAGAGRTYPGFSPAHNNQTDGYQKVPGAYKYYTGKNDPQIANHYYAWRNISAFGTLLDMNRDPSECTAINVGDCRVWSLNETITGLTKATHFGPFQEDETPGDRKFRMWSSDLSRGVNLTYAAYNEQVKGIDTRVYELDPTALYNQTVNPANANYRMTIQGLAPVERTSLNAPVVVSRPHLHSTSADIQNRVSGLDVNLTPAQVKETYWTTVNIEPLSGLAVKGSKKLQINFALDRTVFQADMRYGKLWDLPETQNMIYAPVFWADEYNTINDTDASDFVKGVYDNRKLADNLRIAGFVVGAVLSFIGLTLIFVFVRRPSGDTSQLKSSTNVYV